MDQKIFLLVHELSGKSRLLDFLGVFLADYSGYLLILVAIFIIGAETDWRKKFLNFSLLGMSLLISRGIITEAVRFFYYRPRPFIALNFEPLIAEANKGAFPSGHAAFYFALAGVIWMLDKKRGWGFLIATFLMGLARVFVGVHWPLDILGGALVGALSVLLAKNILGAKNNQKIA